MIDYLIFYLMKKMIKKELSFGIFEFSNFNKFFLFFNFI